MRIGIKGRNFDVTDEFRDKIEKRFEKVSKQVSELATLEIELCMVLEITPRGSALRLVAGVGWREGLLGSVQPLGADPHLLAPAFPGVARVSARVAAQKLGRSPGAVRYKAMMEGVSFRSINRKK